MKERNSRFEEEQSISQASSSFSMEYAGLRPTPSFMKLQDNRVSPSIRADQSRRVGSSRKDFDGLFTNNTGSKVQDRSHLGFLLTPEKYDTEVAHLGINSVLYSPREFVKNHSPKPSLGNERDLYERRIKQMTKDWAIEKASLRKQIKQLEFIVQQWELLDDRKTNGNATRTSDRLMQDVGSPRQSLELTHLKRRLQECEAEKEQMFRDFVELEKELKKVRLVGGNFDNSAISEVRQLELSNHSNDSLRHTSEMEALRSDYERLLLEKDGRYQELMADFGELQEQLEKERTETMILLQKRTTELESSLSTLKIANDEINSELRSSIERTNSQLQMQKTKCQQLEADLNYKEQNVRMLEKILEESRHNLEEMQEVYMNRCVEFDMARLQQQEKKPTQLFEEGTQTAHKQLRDNFCQAEESAAARLSVTANVNYRQENEKLLRRRDQLERALAQRQSNYATLLHAQNELGLSFGRLEANYNSVLKEKAKLEAELQRQISSRQSLELSSSRVQDTGRDQELADLRMERQLQRRQIDGLKAELEEARRKVDAYRNEQQYEKIQLNSQDRVARNNYEVTIHNLTGELESVRIKHQGLEARLQAKKRQLKEKDDFIRNTIVSRTGKLASESEIEYLLRRVDEFLQAQRLGEM